MLSYSNYPKYIYGQKYLVLKTSFEFRTFMMNVILETMDLEYQKFETIQGRGSLLQKLNNAGIQMTAMYHYIYKYWFGSCIVTVYTT